ncbi:MAG TPA: radical SAM family heme chaperone HemW [Thermodesulfovibrionia bacterium]|nr:radical SAM family heme chaperone HemW [Thermodesulfovibrionia bacterium]
MNSIYIHIPFCVKKCHYCDFLSVPYSEDLARDCIDVIVREASDISESLVFDTLYIGGGTPTVLRKNLIAEFLAKVFSAIPLIKGYEATIEANPETIDKEKPDCLLSHGITRLSLGVQSLEDTELVTLGRIHSAARAISAFKEAQKAGFQNINIDLIFGIPGQTLASWKHTLLQVLELKPAHISTYCLTVEEKTELYKKVRHGQAVLPGEEKVLEMYDTAINILETAGFVHYEISNFALPGLACRHNLNYWNRGTYYGLGPGAHSFVNNRRFHNTKNIQKYLSKALCAEDVEEITEKDAIFETIFLGLRKTEGLDLELFKANHGLDFKESWSQQIMELVEAGLIELTNTHVRLTRNGLFLSNEVFLRFMP